MLMPAPTWPQHLDVHGPLPRTSAADLLALADAAEVRGRGGGGFLLGRKLRAAAQHGRGTVVVNCSEGEPASRKDAVLLEVAPHLVVDGALLAARATGARRTVIAAHEGVATRRVRAVLAERPDTASVQVLELPHRYVAGEASALARALAGGPSLPLHRTAPLATGRRPTLVQNAETLACLALLARGRVFGRLVTVGGAVTAPAVIELPNGSTIRDAVRSCGDFSVPVSAVLVGGYAGSWVKALDVPLTVGIVLALPAAACAIAATAQVLRWLADQSARQCGPCRNGLPALAATFEQLAAGSPGRDVVDEVHRLSGLVRGRGACSHPDGAAALALSAVEVFADDVQRHLSEPCGRPATDALGVPRCT